MQRPKGSAGALRRIETIIDTNGEITIAGLLAGCSIEPSKPILGRPRTLSLPR